MTSLPSDARLLDRARARFLESGDLGNLAVRDPILTSWRRSQFWGVAVELPELPFQPDIDTDSRVVRAARPVLERLQTVLAEMAVSVVLTDAHANVLYRWAGEHSLTQDLDAVWLAPGFSYAEAHAGTNAIGTALEEKQISYVFGSEHFSSRLQSLSCAAAPIRHGLTGRTEGIVDVTCRRDDASPLMLVLVRQAAREIEQRLVHEATESEQALLQQFLAANRRADQAMLTVGPDLVIANTIAAQLLGPDDHALVRDQAIELMDSPRRTSTQVLLSGGRPATLRCSPVMSPTGMAGAIVEVSVRSQPPPSLTRRGRSPVTPLPGLAGHSPAWLQAGLLVEAHCRARSWLLVTGEAGVGKCALAEAAHRRWFPTGLLVIVDGAMIDGADDREASWQERIRSHLRDSSATIVIRHVDQMRPVSRRVLADVLGDVPTSPGATPPWLVATSARPDPDGLLERFPVAVAVPPLRHHVDDIRELVPALIDKYVPRQPPGCTSAALQALQRAPWPGNIAQLDGVIHLVVSRRRTGQIGAEDLPPECHATGRRVLTHWETLERDAITEALVNAGGDRVKAASRLGISRATIYRKIHAFGIVVDSAPDSSRIST
ncbi:MAG TPA: helix-turn-helix domain-containing protein [Acidimicrobiales bacterium]|jgi:transcriptional regulator of acetoin/glycerol metabolism